MKSNLFIFFVLIHFLSAQAAESYFKGTAAESEADDLIGYLDNQPEPDDIFEIYDGLLDEIKKAYAALQKENIQKAEQFVRAVTYRIFYKIPAERYDSESIRQSFIAWGKDQLKILQKNRPIIEDYPKRKFIR